MDKFKANFLFKSLLSIFFVFIGGVAFGQSADLEKKIEEAYANGDYTAAIEATEALNKVHKTTENWDEIVINYCKLGYAYWVLEEKKKMEIYVDSALILAKKYEIDTLSPTYGWIWNYSGYYHYNVGAYERSISAFEKNLALQTIHGDSIDIGYGYQNVAAQWEILGDFEKAIEAYVIALEYLGDSNQDKIPVLNNIAVAYQKMEDISKSIDSYQQALTILKKIPPSITNKENEFAILTNLTMIYQDLEAIDSAYFYLEKAEPLVSKKDSFLMSDFYTLEGGLALKSKNYVEAERKLQKAFDLRSTIYPKKNPIRAISYKEIGDLLFVQNRFEDALFFYQKALTSIAWEFNDSLNFDKNPNLSASISDKLVLQKILFHKAKSLQEINQLPLAKNTYALALDLADQRRNTYQAQGSKYVLLKETMTIFEHAIQLAIQQEDKELAFQLMERAKSILLLENLKNTQAKNFAGVPDPLIEQEEQFKKDLVEKERNLAEAIAAQADSTITELNKELFNQRAAYQKFIKDLEDTYPEYHQLKYALEFPTIVDIQEKILPAQTALIEYFMGDSSLYVFIIQKKESQLLVLPKLADLDEQINTLRTLLGKPSINRQAFMDFAQLNSKLSENLVHPILDKLATSTQALMIVPDGALAFLPFQAFFAHPVKMEKATLSRYDTLPYLIKDFAIHYAYSSTLLWNQLAENQTNTAAKDYAGFAPSFDNRKQNDGEVLSALNHNQSEVKQINNLLAGNTFLATAATTDKFKEIANQYKILHLSTHAASHPEAIKTKIHFANDYLTIKDIYNLSLKAELTVLSACETSLGKLQRGEGVISLERAFIYAGCPSLVTSLWQVDDEVTANLMVDFYQNLKAGATKPKALQNIQLTYLENTTIPEKAHPFYWASFIQTGKQDALFSSSFSLPTIALVGIGLFIMGLLYRRFRRRDS